MSVTCRRVNLTGYGVLETVVQSGSSSTVDGIAVDWVTHNVYWTDTGTILSVCLSVCLSVYLSLVGLHELLIDLNNDCCDLDLDIAVTLTAVTLTLL